MTPLHDIDHWPQYNAAQGNRRVRDLCVRVIDLAGPGEDRPALDVGAGLGRETSALIAAGWKVLAIDASPGSEELIRATVGNAAAQYLDVRRARFEDLEQLPRCSLAYAGYSLPYLSPEAFPAFWRLLTASIEPGGWLAVNLFGVNDSWAGTPDMTFLERDELASLLDDFDIVHFHEEDSDGEAFSGTKHWHIFDVIGRKQIKEPQGKGSVPPAR
jgi:SAM-dependent methyltransferase